MLVAVMPVVVIMIMVMVTSRPMHMVVAVIMFVLMPMVMRRMTVIVRMGGMGMISTACRLEGLVDVEDGGAEALQH